MNYFIVPACLLRVSAAPSVRAKIEICVQLENKIILPPAVLECERLDSRNHTFDHSFVLFMI